ncbi:MAG: tol-pal system protein YbgF [Phenylobacterium sp.]|uniref:tol-pal system protein YbgF n=1 Tax=Phenylobacterium sp. TaxID=1871053 RepID=UPI003BB58C7E
MTLRRLALASAAVLTLVSAAPALAQTPIDPLDARDARRLDRMEQVMRELRSIVFQGRDSGKPVVVQPAETDYQLQELTRRIADLEQALTRVNGQLETTNHDLELVKRDAEAVKRDNKALADRLGGVEQRQTAPVAEAGPAPDLAGGSAYAAAPVQTASEAFTAARQLMLGGDYTGAEGAFRDYVDRYDDSAKAPEARYWLGKTLAARGANADAAQAYIGAIRGWPATSWAPDATVELARSLVAIKKPTDACQILGEFDRRYPKATAAVKGRATAARTQAKCAV